LIVLIDPQIGAGAHRLAALIQAEFQSPCTALVAPAEAPDAGLLAALATAPCAIIASPDATDWLARLEGVQIAGRGDETDIVAALAAATSLGRREGATRTPRLRPLAAAELKASLAELDPRWRLDVMAAPRLPQGLKAELVADVPCPTHLAGAELVRAIANVAEAQDHHPTLAQAYRTVTVRVTTGEAAGRLTERDIIFAKAVDGLVAERLPAQ
jgi:pterin-4a-carbinolamine dehydratase